MSYKYCTCGAKIPYDYDPPTKCPKCDINFADAFKKKIKEVEPVIIAAKKEIIEDDNDEYEMIRVKKKKKSAATKTTKELEQEDFSDDDVDLDEVESSAREIAASLNENDLIINYGIEQSQKLGDLFPKQQ